MTDPPQGCDLNNVTYSDTVEHTFTSPAISISPVTSNPWGRYLRASNTNHSTTVPSLVPPPGSDGAYAANRSLKDPVPSYGQHDLATPTVTIHDTDSGQDVANPADSNNASTAASEKLVLAPFGSQPWSSPATGPYLRFAPRPVYEPTGELLNEETEFFDQFDSPTLIARPGGLASSCQSQSDSETQPEDPSNSQNNSEVNVFVQPPLPRSALKRKVESVESSAAEEAAAKSKKLGGPRPSEPRRVSFERMSGLAPTSPNEASTSSENQPSQSRPDYAAQRRTRQSSSSTPRYGAPTPSLQAQSSGRANRGSRNPSGHPPSILPPEKVFPIQIGSELFRLSGASISSDAPSYFTQFFEEQIRQNEESGGVRTLYIDRDPVTFRDVARHLQGYYIKPRDGSHFVKLFADAQFYSLPRLIDQLFESEIFIQIGEKHFQIPKDIFSEPGNSPNFFSLGFAVFFSTPGEVFPGLDRRGLLRPPSITPPYVPGRSAEIFAELLHLLRGYPLHIRNEDHRCELLRDCRYFHLRGLEQKIIAHEISYNLERQKHEICLRLEDVKPSGVSFTPDEGQAGKSPSGGWVYYARPFVDDQSYEVIVEIGNECTSLDLDDMRSDFHNLTKARVSSLFQVIANKMNLPTNAPLGLMMLSGSPSSQSASPGHTPLSEDRVKIRFEPSTDIILDGEALEVDWDSPQGQIMQYGPPLGRAESDSETDVMSEGPSKATPQQAASTLSSKQKKAQGRTPGRQGGQASSSSGSARTTLAVPPIQTSRLASTPAAKKRKRTPGGGSDKMGEWIIRTAQWRLRVQPNPNDSIRGGFEIVFIGVKVDAYSSEHARNSRKSFLGG